MKTRKSISAILLSMLLCISMMTTPMAFASGEVTVTVSGGSQIDFNAGTTEYNVTVPVWYETGVDIYTYEMPTIAVNNAGAAVDVAMPATLPGNATFTIGETNYTIALNLAKNMYEDGGFENTADGKASNFAYSSPTGTTLKGKVDAAYSGTHSVAHARNHTQDPYFYTRGEQTLKKGKVYLASYATRIAPGVEVTEGLEYRLQDCIETGDSTQMIKGTFYLDDVNKGSKTAANKLYQNLGVNLSYEWKVVQAVVEPTTDEYTIRHFSCDSGWTANRRWEQRLDDIFLGELAVGKMSVTDSEGDSASTIIPDTTEDKTLNLTGTLLNQLGTKAGFEDKVFTWSCEGLDVNNGVVTIPANKEAGTYIITATADLSDINNIGEVSSTYTLTIGDAQSAELKTLTVTGNGLDLSQFNFDAATTTYTVGVPVRYAEGVDSYTYAMPVISATPLNNAHETVVTMPVALPGTATVAVKDGENVLKTYTVNLVTLGANIYEDGGMEAGKTYSNFVANGKARGFETTKADAFSGEYSAVRLTSSDYYRYQTDQPIIDVKNPVPPVLSKDVTYLSSYATRLEPSNTTEYSMRDCVETSNDEESATVSFYEDGVKVGTITGTDNRQVLNGNMTSQWKQLQAVVTPSTSYHFMHFAIEYNWSNKGKTLLDDLFLGELIIGGIKIYSDGEELPRTISTTGAHTLTLTAQAVNQLGSTTGLEDKTTTEILSMEAGAPEGVTYENGVLTIPKDAVGTVTLKVRALPTAAWTTAPQESFEGTVCIRLTNEPFTFAVENNKVVSTLAMYPDAPLDVVLYNAIYNNANEEMLISVVSEDLTLLRDTILCKETALKVEDGQVVKSFLWIKGTLTPFVASGSFVK